MDVVVIGAGPAGWAVADACARAGLATTVVAPDPYAPWPATYGLWADQCAALPAGASAIHATAVHAAGREVRRGYAVLDNASVLAAYATGPATAVADLVVGAGFGPRGATVELASGRRLACAVVIDACGQSRVASGGPAAGPRIEQTAYGMVLRPEDAARLVRPGTAVFMDWASPPTFLYAVPLPGDRVLVEETSLAARPGMSWARLAERLAERLGEPVVPLAVERVRFAVDLRATPRLHRGSVPFGAAAGMVHPATGYSVGDSLATAPAVARALADAWPRGPRAAADAGRAAVWSPAARTVHQMRLRGLHALLALPPEHLPEFFGAFFDLPDEQQHAYLSGREDVRGTAQAMLAIFRAAPWGIRLKLATSRQ
ncbi:lycopene cyclase family protein [Actinokineospora sp. NBRC 105648]|uniref:lycopene cyclase family protein n=1 Tax=Actinokineospora sp. NBRC 105648 TaxID=3032206 RepID=UPI0024A394B2|nr:lycopene cyclase family protein [Actinokineospora sp. NBRC 105648]GLZ36999.1 putative carotenoid cyclase [Actinokineospora sp. NBRC 105648]